MKTYRFHVPYFFSKKTYSEELKRDFTDTGFGSVVITGQKVDSEFMTRASNLIKEQSNFEGVVILNVIKLDEVK